MNERLTTCTNQDGFNMTPFLYIPIANKILVIRRRKYTIICSHMH
jgi:hypothetical protein